MTRWRALAFMLTVIFLTACGPSGSGNIVTEERDVGAFDNIEVSGGIALRLTVDPAGGTTVAVTYDDNIIDRIETEVAGSTLRIASSGTYNIMGGGDRFVEVSVQSLQGLTASGGSDVNGEGSIDVLDLTVSGGANVDLSLLPVGDMTLNASGGANVVVNVLEALSGSASGGADVLVQGDPPLQNIDVTGGADLSNG
jgi:hypothetical protein